MVVEMGTHSHTNTHTHTPPREYSHQDAHCVLHTHTHTHLPECTPIKMRIEFSLEQPKGGIQFITPSSGASTDVLVSQSCVGKVNCFPSWRILVVIGAMTRLPHQ